jgi:hypothetical protein
MFSGDRHKVYFGNGKSTCKCGACVKLLRSVRDEDTPVLSLRSASTFEIN